MKRLIAAVAMSMLLVAPALADTASPAPAMKGDHMKSSMKGDHMKGSMKGDHMKGDHMKGDHMKGDHMKGDKMKPTPAPH